jgi:hypothetical protein
MGDRSGYGIRCHRLAPADRDGGVVKRRVWRGLAVGIGAALMTFRAHAAQPRFFTVEGRTAFLEGDLGGVSVDSEGRLRLGPDTRALGEPETTYVWCLTRDVQGILYAGTGHDGKVLRIQGGHPDVMFNAPEMDIHALAAGPDGRVYVASSPDGRVYAVNGSGRVEVFYEPGDKYIWALAFDAAGNLLVGTGSPGRLHRVDPKGRAQIVISGPETHFTALAIDRAGNAYAGTSPGGIVYKVNPTGRTSVVHDSGYREVKALDVGGDGTVYAIVVDGKAQGQQSPATGSNLPAIGTPALTEVSLNEAFRMFQPGGSGLAASPRPPSPAPAGGGRIKGALLRLSTSGESETLWSSPDETPYALMASTEGTLVGTGSNGHLYRVLDDGTSTMVTTFPVEDITALAGSSDRSLYAAGSNPGWLYALAAASVRKGEFISKPFDTQTVSTWGRIRWQAVTPPGTAVTVQTRSGDASTPDATWSDWSAPYSRAEGDPVTSVEARFLQVKVTLTTAGGRSPIVESVSAAYLQRNLRPRLASITVHPPDEVYAKPFSFGNELEVFGQEAATSGDGRDLGMRSSQPWVTGLGRKVLQHGFRTISWRAEDPNEDTLSYDVSYRPVGETNLQPLRKGLTDAILAWDTSTVPDGRYVVRVTASDALSNPAGRALTGQRESEPLDVDNTPPVLSVALDDHEATVHVIVRDTGSLVRKAEYALDAGRWQEVYPTDGINDSREEMYDILLRDRLTPGSHVLVVRARDQLDNLGTARLVIPMR